MGKKKVYKTESRPITVENLKTFFVLVFGGLLLLGGCWAAGDCIDEITCNSIGCDVFVVFILWLFVALGFIGGVIAIFFGFMSVFSEDWTE